jgi:hypothetical protein
MRESSRHLGNREADEVETKETEAQAEETESSTKFAGGKPPPVGDKFDEQPGTSQLAFAEDDREKELKQKVGALVQKRFGGDFKQAFEHYDADKDGGVSKAEISKLLSDAGVGNGLTRGAWASGILKKLDRDENGAIEWVEFESVFSGATASA